MRSSIPRGNITAPPSKSYTHRAMILGALTRSPFRLNNPLISEDTKATLDALTAFGTEVGGDSSSLKIFCEELRPALAVIDARNSGTTARLISGVAALLSTPTTITGDQSLVQRPMGPLMDALTQLGARCTYLGKPGFAPMTIRGPLTGPEAKITGEVSSQFVSSLLIACTQKASDTEIQVTGDIRSRPYIDITIQMLGEFGGAAHETKNSFRVPGKQSLAREAYDVPGDFSSAAFPLVAAAITGGDVVVRNLDLKSPQGDRAIIDILPRFGATVTASGSQVRVSGGRLKGAEIDVRHNPDLFPILAVLGALASGRTVLKGGETLRQKESDRIETTTRFLEAMGARILPRIDGCEIVGVERLKGTTVRTEGDHRILMAAAVAGLAASSETRIEDDESHRVSYPGFIRDMIQLGCRLEVRK